MWVKILLLSVLLSFSVHAQQLDKLLDNQETLFNSLSNLMMTGEQEIRSLKASLMQKEQEIKNLKESSASNNQALTDILNQKELDLKEKDKLLIAYQESSAKDQTLLDSLKKDIDLLELTLNRKQLWNRISLAVLIAMSLIITVETIVLVKKK